MSAWGQLEARLDTGGCVCVGVCGCVCEHGSSWAWLIITGGKAGYKLRGPWVGLAKTLYVYSLCTVTNGHIWFIYSHIRSCHYPMYGSGQLYPKVCIEPLSSLPSSMPFLLSARLIRAKDEVGLVSFFFFSFFSGMSPLHVAGKPIWGLHCVLVTHMIMQLLKAQPYSDEWVCSLQLS